MEKEQPELIVKQKVTYKDLSKPLKLLVILGSVLIINYVFWFTLGFIIGFVGVVWGGV